MKIGDYQLREDLAYEFVLVGTAPTIEIPLYSGIWMGVISDNDKNDWRLGRIAAVSLIYPRALTLEPTDKGVRISFSSVFPGDSKQDIVYIRPMLLHPLGEIHQQTESCSSDNSDLFMAYVKTVDGWVQHHVQKKSGIVLSNVIDLNRLTNKQG